MVDKRAEAEALRDKCRQLANEAERHMINPELTEAQRKDAEERVRVYRKMAEPWADTVVHAADARPKKYTAQNKGPSKITEAKIAYIRSIVEKNPKLKKPQSLVIHIWEKDRAKARELFKNDNKLNPAFSEKKQQQVVDEAAYDALKNFIYRHKCF